MARTVYSQLLGRVASFNSSVPAVLFIADGVHRTVIKCMTIAVGVNITPGSASLIAEGGMYVHSIAAQASDLPTKRSVVSVYGEWVLEPGDGLYTQTEGGWTADFFVSGYLLALP